MAKKKGKAKKNKKQSTNLELIITIILSILLTVLIYTESGYMGVVLSDCFGGMFGIVKYIVPIGAFAVSIKMACKDDDGYISSKIFQYALLLVFMAVILSVYEICNGEINIEQNISEVVKDAYALGENNVGGGALGTIAAVPLFKLFGKIGTIIISAGASLILFAVTFGIDISEMIGNWIQSGVENRKEKQEEKLQAREERKHARMEAKNAERMQIQKESQRAKNIKENRKAYLEIDEESKGPEEVEQIKINLNGRTIEEEPKKGRKKFKHEKEDLVPLGMEEKTKIEPDFIEGNLFKKEEEIKEEKVK